VEGQGPPPLYIQEKVHPKAIIDDLKRRTKQAREAESDAPDLFADFNGLNDPEARTEFYQHDQHWSNRFILGDSLSVLASLAEREGLRGKVQCIYFDPPYGIKFNSNWQVSTLSRDVKDGKQTDVSREPEQIKAFRDTWKDGIHSYLTYLRDRLTVARELLTESGSIFVQIGDENVHRVRAVMDEVFGPENFIVTITVKKTGSQISSLLDAVNDYILWYGRSPRASGLIKSRSLFEVRQGEEVYDSYGMIELEDGRRLSVRALSDQDGKDYLSDISLLRETYPSARLFGLNPLKSGGYRKNQSHPFRLQGRVFPIGDGQCWKHTVVSSDGNTPGMDRLGFSGRLFPLKNDVRFVRYESNPAVFRLSNWWDSLGGAAQPIYVVQTNISLVRRCILMTTDPGDLVLDPTCGSGTTAFVAEQWGRRWVTIDTSRVALALARTRLMSARFPYYLLADSVEGRRKEQELTGRADFDNGHPLGDIRQGFIYERVAANTSGSIANNSEIEVIYEKWQAILEPLRADLTKALGKTWEDWEIPRDADVKWPAAARQAHEKWCEARLARQKAMDASIARAADVEMLYDRPYEDKSKVRVAGPFTVESLSPHRVVPADEEELIDLIEADEGARRRLHKIMPPTDFAEMVLEHLKSAGVHQSEKRDTIRFTALNPWPGVYVGAEGRFMEGEIERRAAIFIGPEFGTLTRVDLAAAAREALDARFDVLIACAFAFDAHASEVTKLGPLPILKAKMSPDLHMAGDLKNTGKGNLFVVFGEPDIDICHENDGRIVVKVKGVDVFDPNTGEIRANDTKGIAAWFIDTDYNEESFFVRHAYFLGANDPYKSLKTALQAEIDKDAWETLYRAESRPFERPTTGKIAVKVINHFGDEVMKVFRV
jgi:adenine-specific DNA-methyltransferase